MAAPLVAAAHCGDGRDGAARDAGRRLAAARRRQGAPAHARGLRLRHRRARQRRSLRTHLRGSHEPLRDPGGAAGRADRAGPGRRVRGRSELRSDDRVRSADGAVPGRVPRGRVRGRERAGLGGRGGGGRRRGAAHGAAGAALLRRVGGGRAGRARPHRLHQVRPHHRGARLRGGELLYITILN